MKKLLSAIVVLSMTLSLAACGSSTTAEAAEKSEEDYAIEEELNLANNEEQEWTYSETADAWVLSIVSAVTNPEIPDQQGVSVCVPGAYITGIDTDGDGTADVTSADAADAINGSLVIDYDAEIVSTNGQTYTAATAPVIINTGAAGYSSSTNTLAATTYASEGYINVSCGNRGKQDTVTDENGDTVYTGDAPSCLVDQKNAVRFVKYNILLGNLPGSVDYFVSTGGSGGGAHATMLAATSNNSDFYAYEAAVGAVGVYAADDGTYITTVTIDGTDYDLSDGVWGCIAYSAITSLKEADMAMAFEYYMDTTYEFGSDFQAQLAEYLSEEYMEYINEQNLSVNEADVGFDLNGDGDQDDTIELTIEYDMDKYADTNGYGGTYLDLYLAEFQSNLQWYLDNLDYAEGWTWFDEDGNALSDDEVAAMTTADKAEAFIEGRYAKGSSGGMGGAMMGGMMDGAMGGGMMGGRDNADGEGRGGMNGGMDREMDGDMPSDIGGEASGEMPADMGEAPDGAPDGDMPGEMGGLASATTGATPDGDMPNDMGGAPDGEIGGNDRSFDNAAVAENSAGDTMDVGTPDAGTTQAAGSSTDSKNYATFDEMLAAYESDIAEIEAGDQYGNNIVDLYDPLNYIGADGTDDPTWVRILMGAAEGDMSMFSSLNLQIAMLNAGVDANIEWQWDGGHVPSEVLSESFSLYVDQMYAKHAGGDEIETPAAEAQTANGTATEATGTDLSSWVDSSDITNISFTLADAVAYRTAGASKAIPGFDVIDYGQEDYVFGSSTQDARHWNSYLLEIFQEHSDTLAELFNSSSAN
ncbi:MAG: hypothetical protein LUE88_05200 [Clostridiales bacterium]|nr:hypothetical protein [Clostridiales bacterium]